MTKKEPSSRQLSKIALIASKTAIRENKAYGLESVYFENGKLVKVKAGSSKLAKTSSSKRKPNKVKSKTLKIA